ncbi:MAG: N-6 DNA methylase [Sulfolobus sp.]
MQLCDRKDTLILEKPPLLIFCTADPLSLPQIDGKHYIATVTPTVATIFYPMERLLPLSVVISRYLLTIMPTRDLDKVINKIPEIEKIDIQDFLVVYLRDYVIKSIVEYLKANKTSRQKDNEKAFDDLRMMAYAFVNEVIYYKILERYRDVKRLLPLYKLGIVKSSREYLVKLNEVFKGTTELIQFGDDNEVAQVLDSLITLLDSLDLDLITKVANYVYDGLIPDKERRKLSQFYTPPVIAELIVKWAVRREDYKVLDAGTGSGVFISEAYDRLYLLKTGKEIDIDEGITPTQSEHSYILGRLYAVDLNPFAVQLTSMRLSLKSPKYQSKPNVITGDFFKIKPGQSSLDGVSFSNFDAVIGNPPYTRWNELSKEEKKAIRSEVGKALDKYGLVSNGREDPPIYIPWIVHAERFLKEHGKLGMIISDMWLQTEYGKNFAKYLLDHFKIKAIIDIPQKIFDARIATVILLAEKETDAKSRASNKVLVARVIDAKKAINCIKSSLDMYYEFDEARLKECNGLWFKFVRQEEIKTDRKLIHLFFDTTAYDELERLVREGKMIRLGRLFEPSRGNSVYHCLSSWGVVKGTPNCGAKDFFRLNEEKKKKVPEECLYPAIIEAELVRSFIFTRKDWEEMRDRGKSVYLFICHKPKGIKEYVEKGEKEYKNRNGAPANEAEAAKAREKEKNLFYGWYDLGGVMLTPLMAKYMTQYSPHFFISEYPVAVYDGIMSLIPKVKIEGYDVKQLKTILRKVNRKRAKEILKDVKKNSGISLSTKEIKALAAYLNSTLVWNWLEFMGRPVAGGPLAIDVKPIKNIPIPNLKELSEKDVNELASLFDDLETEARKHRGEKVLDALDYLKPIKQKIDKKICEIYSLNIDLEALWNSTVEMMKKRMAAKAGKRLELGLGKEVKVKKGKKDIPLDSFIW